MECVTHSIKSHDRQIGENASRLGEMTGEIERLEESVEKLVAVSNENATAIRTLARIVEAHEQ